MRRIVIVGARHRGWNAERSYQTQEATEKDTTIVSELLTKSAVAYGEFIVLSLGCDFGFGRMVLASCEDRKIPFVEVRIKRSRKVPKDIYELLHIARHAALLELGEEFHLFIAGSRISNVEDFVQRLEIGKDTRPYYVYDEEGSTVSTNQS
jgi:hypothetical protein